jgi:hypothetical protein
MASKVREVHCPVCGIPLVPVPGASGEIAVSYSFLEWAGRCRRAQLESPALCLLAPAGRPEHDKPDGLPGLHRYS